MTSPVSDLDRRWMSIISPLLRTFPSSLHLSQQAMLSRGLFRAAGAVMHGQRMFSSRHVTEITRVGVVGLGLMGHGIAQVTAMAGYPVVAVEREQAALTAGQKRIEGSLDKLLQRNVKKGTMTADAATAEKNNVLSRVTYSTDMNAVHDCDIVIEAIAENMQLKLDFYTDLARRVKPEAIFASNTSSLPITGMAEASGRGENFVGLHFFNPVQIMKLVEVIRTKHTNAEVFDLCKDFVTKLGKVAVSCKDTPGFIVNRLLVPYMSQAMLMVDRGDASIPDIDVSMMYGAGHPMGPITLADYVGLDTTLSILNGWKHNYPDEPAFVVPECLKAKVAKGELGRKTGKGFYHWDGDTRGALAE